MSIIAIVAAVAALVVGLVALSRGKEANERADDCMRYLFDAKNSQGTEIKELFRQMNRLKARVKRQAGQLDEVPYEITDACVACGTCETQCPEGAIAPGEIYRIDPDLCTACGSCEEVCPVDACVVMKIE